MARNSAIFSSTFAAQSPLVIVLWALQTGAFPVAVQPPRKKGDALGDLSLSDLGWELVNAKAT